MTDYTVRQGENLTRIAARYNTTVEELVRINKISNPDKINEGQVIKLVEEKNTEEAKPEENLYAKTSEELKSEMKKMQEQLSKMQETMATPQEDNLSGMEIFGYGLAGAATLKATEKALPYVQKAGKSTQKAIRNAAGAASKKLTPVASAAKKGVVNAGKTVSKAGKTALEVVGKGFRSIPKGLGVVSKSLGAAAIPLAVVGVVSDAVDAYKEGGTKEAAKCVGKNALCVGVGAAVGSIIPVVGTATGAAIGAIVASFI